MTHDDKKLMQQAVDALVRAQKELQDITALRERLALEDALDRMAENARELGLDYEPKRQEFDPATQTEGNPKLDANCARQEQEPVAWRTFDGEGGYDYRSYDENENYAAEWNKRNPRHAGWVEPLYTAPQPERKWVGLTQPEVVDAFCQTPHKTQYVAVFEQGARWAEARLKEKNHG